MSGLRGSWNFPSGQEPKDSEQEPVILPVIVGVAAIFIGALSIHIGLAMILTGLIPLYIGMTRYWDVEEQLALVEIKKMVEDLGLEDVAVKKDETVPEDGGENPPTLGNSGGGADGETNDGVPPESTGKGKNV